MARIKKKTVYIGTCDLCVGANAPAGATVQSPNKQDVEAWARRHFKLHRASDAKYQGSTHIRRR